METIHDQRIEDALIGLAKLLKNVSYYPDGHPSLNNAIAQSIKLFGTVNLASQEPLVLIVSRQGFFLDHGQLESKNPLINTLAQRLFFHKIKRLTLFPDLLDRHLLAFARLICEEPVAIIDKGGIAELLDRQLVSTISINMLNLSAAASRKNKLEQQQGSTSVDGAGKPDQSSSNKASNDIFQSNAHGVSIHELLQQLDGILHQPTKEKEPLFLRTVGQLSKIMRQMINDASRMQTLPALQQLDCWIQNSSLNQRFVNVLKQAVRSLGSQELVDLLIDNASDTPQQNLARHLIAELNSNTGVILIDRLSNETNTRLRKFISQLLVSRGEQVFAPLIASLNNERWFVVRNAVAILGESRDERLVPTFASQLNHSDARVVNEAIRALARIKTTSSSQALIDHLSSGNSDFPQQIILALGALADPIAVPYLTSIATRSDPFLRNKTLTKVAIAALGEIGAPEAVPTLIKLLQRIKLLKRAEYAEIRCQAALTLGSFNDSASLKALQRVSKSSQRNLAAAARQALRQRGEADNG
ncbi:MAG: HEAT repeat domain-containing protein [Desulfuromonas sp.]|nr:HEAT repeat domain-containing protein [Desulfuromonas sp.]